MHPGEVQSRLESAARLFEQGRHPDALSVLEGIGHLLPSSPMLMLMRVESLAATGQITEAVRECDRLVRRIDQIREAGDMLDNLLDIDQASVLSEMLTSLADCAGTLKNDLGRRQAEALDAETLQSTVTRLQARLDSFMSQRGHPVQEQEPFADELSLLRGREHLNSKALEMGHTEPDAMKHMLLRRG
jgi:hypothetical protein